MLFFEFKNKNPRIIAIALFIVLPSGAIWDDFESDCWSFRVLDKSNVIVLNKHNKHFRTEVNIINKREPKNSYGSQWKLTLSCESSRKRYLLGDNLWSWSFQIPKEIFCKWVNKYSQGQWFWKIKPVFTYL